MVILSQSKIKDRFWVLNECIQKVPEDYDAMNELLKYGLFGTSLQVFKQIDIIKGLPFVIRSEGDEEETEASEKPDFQR